jgi:uracil-DNA glycosylase
MGLEAAEFYDQARVALVPMAFCFPGYDAKGSDLPPPAICAATWRARVMAALPQVRLTLAVGGAAMRWHLGPGKVAGFVQGWRHWLDTRGVLPLPHPSWRNTSWLKANPWFEGEVLPVLRARVRDVMEAE